MTVGTDSYVSLVYADDYLDNAYLSTDAKYIAWDALTNGNKEKLLTKATREIEKLSFIGKRTVTTQTLAFPRLLWSDHLMKWVDIEVPDEVKQAQCELAIQLSSGTSERLEMQRQGVKSFSLGKLSESYALSKIILSSTEARDLLSKYTGSVKIT